MSTPPAGPPDSSGFPSGPGYTAPPGHQPPGPYPAAGYPAQGAGPYPGPGNYPPPGSQPAPAYPPSAYPPPAYPPSAYPPSAYPPPAYPASTFPPPTFPPPGQLPPPGGVFPAAPSPPAPPAKNPAVKRNRIIAAVVLVVLIGAGVFFYIQSQKTETANAKVADCIQVDSTTTIGDPDTNQVPCTDPKALLVVTEVGDANTKCEDLELTFEQRRGGDVTDRLCLRPNLAPGQCYIEPLTSVNMPQVGACSTLTGATKVKVLSVNTTTSDASKCPDKGLAYSYPKRNVLICFGKV